MINDFASCPSYKHEAPHPACRCGLHIYHDRGNAEFARYKRWGSVLMRVELFGEIVRHGSDSRGEEQVVTKVWFPDRCERMVRVAAVAGGFPHGQIPLSKKLEEIDEAIDRGADEIDMVFDRELFNMEKYGRVFDEIVAVKETCLEKGVKLKVILETGELRSYAAICRAAWLSILAGADFVKTSTGKITVGATPESTLLVIESVRDWYQISGEMVGVKPSGGVSNTMQAVGYLSMVRETAGEVWLNPNLFRFGASRLLTDLVMVREKLKTGSLTNGFYESEDRGIY